MTEPYVLDMKEDEKYIHIPLCRYKELIDAERFLNFLEEQGVKSWDGYDEAMAKLNANE